MRLDEWVKLAPRPTAVMAEYDESPIMAVIAGFGDSPYHVVTADYPVTRIHECAGHVMVRILPHRPITFDHPVPTKPGWYWWRWYHDTEPEIVRVIYSGEGLNVEVGKRYLEGIVGFGGHWGPEVKPEVEL